MIRNKKSQSGVGIVIVLVIIILAAYAGYKMVSGNVDIEMKFEDGTVHSGETTKLYVTVKNNDERSIEGTLSVKAINGQDYVAVSTQEDANVKLATEGSERTLVYIIVGHSDVTVEPILQAELKLKNGKTLTTTKSLRIKI